MRLVDADAMIAIAWSASEALEASGQIDAFERGTNKVIKFVKSLPAIEGRKKGAPIYKHGESAVHVSYADGHGGFESHKWADWVCPECGWFVGEQYVPRRHNQQKANFCGRCGCEIDWDNATMEGKE